MQQLCNCNSQSEQQLTTTANHGFDDTQSDAVLHFVKRHCHQLQMLWLHAALGTGARRLHHGESTTTTHIL